MPSVEIKNRTFDARPDRVDLRDREYQPRLHSLPDVYPPVEFVEEYLATYPGVLVLDQGSEGACTGFGLAAMINFLLWRKSEYQQHTQVSPRMAYQLARIYDEWPGEDYSGSSCRGAMRGWHRHGVCSEELWPYRDKKKTVKYIAPKVGWAEDAAQRPLGAYYRINKDSIADMQAAICEVGAIYVSARVHEGWYLDKTDEAEVMDYPRKHTGGHAFTIGGYNADGFLVQNSWGSDWGFNGFAFLSYKDWIENGVDAWVAVLGAPMRGARAGASFSSASSSDVSFGESTLMGGGKELNRSFPYKNDAVRPASEVWAYRHSLVLGNNGMALNKLLGPEHAEDAIEEVCYSRPSSFFKDKLPPNAIPRLAIYVHGGLNSEEDSIKRNRVLGPYFRENGIYPLFITWRTGVVESLEGIVADKVSDIFGADDAMPQESVIDAVKKKLADARDRTIEVACKNLLVKPLWSEMKQNAEAAAQTDGGVRLLIQRLTRLNKEFDKLELHLVGHSAGAIVLGQLLTALRKKMEISSVSLYAPACTLDFAVRHYGGAMNRGVLAPGNMHVDNMDDERERADKVGPYGKSLLYLVSRALESRHKTPLLGLDYAWRVGKAPQDHWHNDAGTRRALKEWSKVADSGVKVKWHTRKQKYVSTGAGKIRLAHGSFDNDTEVIETTLRRIRGSSLLADVECLDY